MIRAILLVLLGAVASAAFAADQRPIVISATTGQFQQLQPASRLSLPTSSGGFAVTIDPGAQTATRVLSVPVLAGADTVDVLGVAQTVSATKTFTAAQIIAPAASVDKTLSVGVATAYSMGSLKTASVFYADNSNWGFPCVFVADSAGRGAQWVTQGYNTTTNTGNAAYLSLTNATTTELYLYQNGTSAVVPTFNIQAGKVVATGTSDSTTTTSGALVSSGGVGVAKNITSGATITAATRIVGVSPAFSSYGVESSAGFGATQTTANVSGTYSMDVRRIAGTSATGTHHARAISSSLYGIIATGQSNTGSWIGSHTEALRNYVVSGDTGTLSTLTAYNINYGHFNTDASTPTTNTATGLSINSFFNTGTVTQAYGIFIQAPSIGGTLTAYTALQIGNTAGTSSKAIATGTGVVSFADTTSASSSTAGAFVVGNGTAATSVAVGSGIVWAGGVLRSNAGIGVLKNGSDTFNSGGTIALNNAANTDGMWLQNSASGHLDIYGYVASVATKALRLQNTGELLLQATTDASAIGTADLVVPGGATFAKSIGLGLIAAPGTQFLGQVWNDSTQQTLFANLGASTANRLKQSLVGTIATAYGATGPTNTTTEGTFITNGTTTGTFTLPANFLTAGKTLRLSARGVVGNTASAALTTKVKFGSTVCIASVLSTIANAGSVNNYELSAVMTCTSTGATGHVNGVGWFAIDDGTARTRTVISMQFGTATIDTTASQVVDATATWGAASVSDALTNGLVQLEALN